MEMRFILLLSSLFIVTWLLVILKSFEIKDKIIELEDELREVAKYSADSIQRIEKRVKVQRDALVKRKRTNDNFIQG